MRDLNGTLSLKKWHGWQMILRRCGAFDLSYLILSNQMIIFFCLLWTAILVITKSIYGYSSV